MRKIIFLSLFVGLIDPSFASINKTDSLKLEKLTGHYEVLKGSHKSCHDGVINIVGEKEDRGLRIGQNIFLGPFSDSLIKASKTSCSYTTETIFKENSLISKSIVKDCPNSEDKLSEGTSTQTLKIEKDHLEFINLESKIKCQFKKSKEVE